MAEGQYGVRIAHSKAGSAYIAGLYGPDGVARKLKELGLERNLFQKWVKQAAMIVAQRATHLAPRDTGRLALSLRAASGKKITPNNRPAQYLFGGVVIAQAKERGATDSYAKAISFGRYYAKSSLTKRIGAKFSGDSRGVRTAAIRTKGNPYLRTAKNDTRSAVVKMWNKEIGRWIESNGIDVQGLVN
jgi:hypothetical protein